jgi:hypothetical protein
VRHIIAHLLCVLISAFKVNKLRTASEPHTLDALKPESSSSSSELPFHEFVRHRISIDECVDPIPAQEHASISASSMDQSSKDESTNGCEDLQKCKICKKRSRKGGITIKCQSTCVSINIGCEGPYCLLHCYEHLGSCEVHAKGRQQLAGTAEYE